MANQLQLPCPVSRLPSPVREPGLPRPVLEPGLLRGNRDYRLPRI
ncbi:MAG: hypothetical protein NTW99_02620 [Chloroflexi bacterium]|nr:hypothetical protein [Chloroflexota bacterium]